MNCIITQEDCIIRPSGFVNECFVTCPRAQGFLAVHNLTYRGINEIVDYLEDVLYSMRQSPRNQSMQFYLKEVIKYFRRNI